MKTKISFGLLVLLCLGFGVKKANAFCPPDYCTACDQTYASYVDWIRTCNCTTYSRDIYCMVNASNSEYVLGFTDNCDNYDVNWGVGGWGSSCATSGFGGGGAGTGCMK